MEDITTIQDPKAIEIRNSTAEFLIFKIEGKEDGVQVLYRDETIWCTQDAIAMLFDKAKSTINEHLKNILLVVSLTQMWLFGNSELPLNTVQ